MGHAVEEHADVQIEHPVLSPAALTSLGQRVVGGSPRTVAVAVGVEDRLQLLLQQHGGCSLGDAVGHRGHAEHPDPSPMVLGDLHRSHGHGEVAAGAHPVPELVEVVDLVGLELGDAGGVHSRRPIVGTDPLPRLDDEALGDVKRLHLLLWSLHQLLPERVGVWMT